MLYRLRWDGPIADRDGRSPLWLAAFCGAKDAAQHLVSTNSIDVTSAARFNFIALHAAVLTPNYRGPRYPV